MEIQKLLDLISELEEKGYTDRTVLEDQALEVLKESYENLNESVAIASTHCPRCGSKL